MPAPAIVSEMRLFSPKGQRLYITKEERVRFLAALDTEDPKERMFCYMLYYTGCRPSEALALTPQRILLNESSVVFETLKKRKYDNQGREKHAQYRTVPVPAQFIDRLDLVFDLRNQQKNTKNKLARLWPMSRPTAYRLVKRVMHRAGIEGQQATGKGLRHGFGVAMVTADKPLQLHVLAQIMGHSSTKTTEIYLQVVGEERHKMVLDAWDDANT